MSDQTRAAIVYLAQNTRRNPQYQRDSRGNLERSLDLLYSNYNDRFRHDVVIFHNGDFSSADQDNLRAGRPEIKFHTVVWKTPDHLPAHEIPPLWDDGTGNTFGMGHRHMYLFYAQTLFDLLANMGYDWCMRLDDDSFLHDLIEYDLFAHMQQGGFDYGYRVEILEGPRCSRGFRELVTAYLRAEQIDETGYQRARVSPGRKLVVAAEALTRWLLSRGGRTATPLVSPLRCHDQWCFYNNFFITRIGFWHSEPVQRFLGFIVRSGGIYKYRWTDLLIQSAAVQIFLPPKKVHKFTDWSYEHASVQDATLLWGGHYGPPATPSAKAFKKSWGALRMPLTWSR